MAYAAIADMQKRIAGHLLEQLAPAVAPATLDNDRINTAIADADALIDGYLGSRYAVPFTTVPPLIKKLSVDIAIYYLHQGYQELKMPEGVKERYDDAIRSLEELKSGEILLAGSTSAAALSAFIRTNKTADDRIFTAESLAGM